MMPPPIFDNENAPLLADWLRTVPGIPSDWPMSVAVASPGTVKAAGRGECFDNLHDLETRP